MVDTNVPQEQVTENEWERAKCDKYDYLIAAFCGGAAGLIDVFFVGAPLTSMLGDQTDRATDKLVQKAAQFFWKNDKRTLGKNKRMPETLEQCISYLEQAFPVNYDARYAKDLLVEEGILSGMRPLNHHLLSLAHSPDPIGLIFSIINQFMGYATFVDQGQIIHVLPAKTSGAIPYMQGSNLPSMLFCGFVNWIGHLLSDIAGSSSTRTSGKTGRGAGIPIPFYELFLGCNFGNFDGNTFAEVMLKVFEQGYDLRHGAAMAIPVILNELMIRVLWTVRQKFVRRKSWKDSVPDKRHADLRIMLIVGHSVLCAIDGTGAAIASGGNVISFICHLNLIGWARLVMLILRELMIRYGPVISRILNAFVQAILDTASPVEQRRILAFRQELIQIDTQIQQELTALERQIEREYQLLQAEVRATTDEGRSTTERFQHSIKVAEICDVDGGKIIHNHKELDDRFL